MGGGGLRVRTLATPAAQSPPLGDRYARYVLGVLVLVYIFNFLDRQIISILAERIKADLRVTDAEIGFLYGTAFAVFYAVFGIPLARLADVWDRRKLIAIGLAVWSLMTVLSGLARDFTELAIARFGVGIGEASAAPAAFSLLSDSFPAARRATALAVYSSGIYIGAGLGLILGGWVVDRWDSTFVAAAPFGLRGWQVAFFAAGLPGLLLALWVVTLREPRRGSADGIFSPVEAHPFREFFFELRSVLPPFTLLHLARIGAGRREVARNLGAAALIAAVAVVLGRVTRTPSQWIALGIGLYAAFSWTQALGRRDPVAHALILRASGLRYAALAFSFMAFQGYGIGFWTPPFFVRFHGVDERQAGLVLGAIAAVGGWLGITLGGVLADFWRRSSPCGRLYVGMLAAVLPVPIVLLLLSTTNLTLAYALTFPSSVCSSLWIGPAASTVQDLVLPRMRGSATAAYLLLVTFIGLALGPYAIGLASVVLGDLRGAMLTALAANVAALAFSLLAARRLPHDEATRIERARAAGESFSASA
ncbi:MAG: MFS transporter [Candidatus Binatia bacterium]